MSYERFIQWALKYGALDEKELRYQMPSIEHFCDSHSIAVEQFLYVLVDKVNIGISIKSAVKEIMDKAL